MSEIKGDSPNSHLAHLAHEVNKHCPGNINNGEISMTESEKKTWVSSIIKPPYIYCAILPIIIFILIIYVKPGFVKKAVRVSDDSNELKYVTDFKKILISTVIISAILCFAFYYFILRKKYV